MTQKALTSSESSSVMRILAAFWSASRSFATRYPAMDHVCISCASLPTTLAFLESLVRPFVFGYANFCNLDGLFSNLRPVHLYASNSELPQKGRPRTRIVIRPRRVLRIIASNDLPFLAFKSRIF